MGLGFGVQVSAMLGDVRFRLGVYGLSLCVTPIAPNHQAVPPKTGRASYFEKLPLGW